MTLQRLDKGKLQAKRAVGELRAEWDNTAGYYSEHDLDDLIKERGEEDWLVEKLREEGSYFDDDESQWTWDDEMTIITDLMQEVGDGRDITHWHADVDNQGWRSRDGYKDFEAKDGSELLQKVLPDTDNHFKIYEYTSPEGIKGIAINNAHHDSPMWAEWYYVIPQQPVIDYEVYSNGYWSYKWFPGDEEQKVIEYFSKLCLADDEVRLYRYHYENEYSRENGYHDEKRLLMSKGVEEGEDEEI